MSFTVKNPQSVCCRCHKRLVTRRHRQWRTVIQTAVVGVTSSEIGQWWTDLVK